MAGDLNSVKIDAAERRYHHGALREALIGAAEAVIAERGIDRFSLRETARRAGVSPAAPGHHFRDARGLLTALAAQTFREFGDALEAADIGPDRAARIRSQAMAYVRFALANRAKFDLMWRKALIDDLDPEYAAAGNRAFAILDRVVRGEQCTNWGSTDSPISPSIAAWSIVHGFARLAIDGVFGTEPDAAQRAADTLLPQILDCLRV
jgi:AcrR family transcriptional regulator